MSFNKNQLGKDSKDSKKVVHKPAPIIPVAKYGGMKKMGGRKC